jgi:DnaK suppressor protein
MITFMFSQDQLDKFRDRLEQRIHRLKQQQDASSDQRSTVTLDQQSVGRLSRMDAMQQQAMALATDRRRQVEISKALAALETLSDDDFGYCQECGESIGAARLNHDPALILCIGCAKAR